MNKDLTRGPVMRSMLWFALPMILGNLLQQCYNIADTLIVGRFLGKTALAAVGSSFSLMTFLTSILLGLCMGSGALFSIRFGQRDEIALKESVRASFMLILGVTLLLNGLAFACLDLIKSFLQVPDDVWGDVRISQSYSRAFSQRFYIITSRLICARWVILSCRSCFWRSRRF